VREQEARASGVPTAWFAFTSRRHCPVWAFLSWPVPCAVQDWPGSPVQMLAENWQCASSGGRYDVALRACAYRAAPRVTPQTTWPVKLQHEREW